MLALAVLPVLAVNITAVQVELKGGLFQDFAPSFHHLRYVMIPLLQRMGIDAVVEMVRPGYVPLGQGILRLSTNPIRHGLRPLVAAGAEVEGLWGVALPSHLEQRTVSDRMASSAGKALGSAGYRPDIQVHYDTTALQPGAALALFADLRGGARVGADRAGAPRRPAESIGKFVARQLLQDLDSQATLDRYASDQVIPFAALAKGESQFRIPSVTDHIQSNAWLAREFLGADVRVEDNLMVINGAGFPSRA